MTKTALAHDICVCGAGPAGLAAALAVAAKGLAVTVLGQALPGAATTAAEPDTRTTAILGDGVTLLENISVWGALAGVSAPIAAIRVIDDRGGLLTAPEVLFQAGELDLPAFGYNVPNSALRAALLAAAERHPRITLVATEGVVQIVAGADDVILKTTENTSFATRLLIAADGRSSLAPRAAGIAMRTWTYDQFAIAASFGHSAAHDGISTELHRRPGPLTTVPLPDGADGARSGLVWVETPDEARRLMALDDEAFGGVLQRRLKGLLGDLRGVGRRATFPLGGAMATSVASHRIVLAGEAGHVLPPIGAQGLNLGLRDAAAIADAVAGCADGDPGGPDVMGTYARARASDLVSREIGIDLLNRSLLVDFLPVQAMRGLGLHALANSRTLRRAAMRAGLRGPGEVPTLMRRLAKTAGDVR